MQGITFTIQNPDSIPEAGQPVIYTDKLDKSELTFSFTQDLGIPSVGPKDSFRIRFPQTALSSASPKMLNSKYWMVEDLQKPAAGNPYYTFVLQPAKTISFADKTIDIAFKGLPGKAQTMADVSVTYKIEGAPVPAVNQNAKLHVTAYPDKPATLSDNILFPSVRINAGEDKLNNDTFYLSSAGLRPPIANKISLNLKFSESQLVAKWDPQDKNELPFFQISFSYGLGTNDLTDATLKGDPGYNQLTTAYEIVASVGENNLWQVLQETGTTTWRIVPTASNLHLFTKENNDLDITFSHVISRLPAGNATIFIQWGNIPGYNPGWKARNIVKQSAKAKIFSFSSPDGDKTESVPFGKGIRFDWTVFAAPMVQLRCPEAPSLDDKFAVPAHKSVPALSYCGGLRPAGAETGDTCTNLSTQSIIPIYPKNTFYLRPIDLKGQEIGDEVGPITVTISDYPSPSLKKKLSAQSAIFNVVENGSPTYYYNKLGGKVKLDWELEDPRVVRSINISGPDGSTIEIIKDSKQMTATIPMASEGTYTINFISRERGQDLSQGIILKSLANKIANTTLVSDSLVAINENYPMGALAFAKNVVLNPAYKTTPVLYHFNIQLHFQKDGTGSVKLVPTKYSIAYTAKYYTAAKIIKLDPITQPIVVSPPNPVTARTFHWQIATDGSLRLSHLKSPATWTIGLKKNSSPDKLLYFSNAATEVAWMKSWPITTPTLAALPASWKISYANIVSKGILTPLSVAPTTSPLGPFKPENAQQSDYYFKKQ